MTADVFYATQGQIVILSPGMAIGSDFTAQVKELRITGAERDVEGTPCFGTGINVKITEKQPTLLESELTLVMNNIAMNQMLMSASPYGQSGAWSSTWGIREQSTLNYWWRDTHDVSGAELKLTLASVYAVNTEMSISADDHLEQTVTFKLAPQNFAPKYTANRVVNPL